MAEVLNLNNEVVKMRKEIKKARALIIRKLTRQIVQLKKKKGKAAEVEKNQRRAARLLEEIHEMKDLRPDNVTKTALMKDLRFEKVCKNPNSTLSERATARIATHPQISKRIREIKAAVEAFKDERKTPAGGKASKPGKPAEDPKVDGVKSDDLGDEAVKEVDQDGQEEEVDQVVVEEEKVVVEEEKVVVEEEEEEDEDDGGSGGEVDVDEDEGEEREEGLGAAKDCSSPTKEGPTVKTGDAMKVTPSKSEMKGPTEEAEVLPKEQPQTMIKLQEPPDAAHKLENSKTATTKEKKTLTPAENESPQQSQSNPRVDMKSPMAKAGEEEEEEESDLDSSDDDAEEKEYFDDSTEERFHKQSSQSEGSDEDDFFLGKVSKCKKRKSGLGVGEKKGEGGRNVNPASALKGEAEGRGQQGSKAAKLESVFCATLSGSRGAPGNRGRGPRAFSKPHGFQNDRRQQVRTQKPALFQNRGGGQDRKPMPSKFQNQRDRVQDRGPASAKARPQFEKPRDHRGAAGRFSNPSQHAQQALHPSWEASKRRKEQQAQITAFQGKKIKFDD